MKRTKIGILSSHQVIRTAIVELLETQNDFEVCLEFPFDEKTIEHLDRSPKPDIVIVDVASPVRREFQAIQGIREVLKKRSKILIFSNFTPLRIIESLIMNGADGFLHKSCSKAEFFNAVRATMIEGFYLSSSIMTRLKRPNDISSYKKTLSNKEEKMVNMICRQMTSHEIADKLHLSVHSVNTYRTRLINKLDVKNSIGLVLYAIEHGIFIPDNVPDQE